MNKKIGRNSMSAIMAGLSTLMGNNPMLGSFGKAKEKITLEELGEMLFEFGGNIKRDSSNKRRGKMATSRRFKNKRARDQRKINRIRMKG